MQRPWGIQTMQRGAVPACVAVLLLMAPAAASAGVVGQWRFDESDGQVVHDDGPFALHGALGGTDSVDAGDPARIAGATGGALRFDGRSVVRLPDTPQLELQAMTAEAVVQAPVSPGQWRYIVSRGAEGCLAGSYGLYTGAAGGVALYVFDGSRYVVSATARPGDVWDGRWHHVAGTFDGQQLRLYVDGRLVGDPMPAALRVDYAGESSHAYFGQYAGACDLAFRGDADLVRLSSGALGPDAIAAAAAAATGAPAGAPLPPASPGTVIPAPGASGPRGGVVAGPPAPIVAPPPPAAAPPPAARARPGACAVHLSRTRIAPRGRTVVQARVVLRSGQLRALQVVAHRTGRRPIVAKARTSAAGLARLVFQRKRAGRLKVTVSSRPSCTPAYLLVTRGH